MFDYALSRNDRYPGNPNPELDRQTPSRSVFHPPAMIEDIQASANNPTHEGRTRVLIDSPDHVTIVSGYRPGEGEVFHTHHTRNTLLFLAGTFDLWLMSAEGEEEHHETYPGMIVALDRGQPHRVQARADQEGLSIVMVSIVEGMSTSAPGYSISVNNFPPIV